jgi:hypothetical protein
MGSSAPVFCHIPVNVGRQPKRHNSMAATTLGRFKFYFCTEAATSNTLTPLNQEHNKNNVNGSSACRCRGQTAVRNNPT